MKVTPGMPMRRLPAAVQNNILEAAEDYAQRRRMGTPAGRRGVTLPTDLIKIQNNSGAARARGHVLEITGIIETTFSHETLAFVGGAPTPGADKRYAILKEDLPDGEIGVAQVSGICAAVVNVTDATHKTATIAASTYILQSSANGPIPMFYQPAGTGATHECAINLPPVIPYKPFIHFTLSGALDETDASQSGTIVGQMGVGLSNPNTGSGAVTLHNVQSSPGGYLYSAASGTHGLALWRDGNNYIIMALPCPN